MNNITPFVILSAARPQFDRTVNAYRHGALRARLAVFDTFDAVGYWRGERELSLLVSNPGQRHTKALADVAFLDFGQDAILSVDANGCARLIYADGREESAGQWREVRDATGCDCYTEIDGRYYVAA